MSIWYSFSYFRRTEYFKSIDYPVADRKDLHWCQDMINTNSFAVFEKYLDVEFLLRILMNLCWDKHTNSLTIIYREFAIERFFKNSILEINLFVKFSRKMIII